MHLSDPQDNQFILDLFPKKYRSLIPAFVDERDPEEKRAEFNRMRDHLFDFLQRTDGLSCQLNLEVCDPSRGFDVDHLIPLSSNVLNKSIRKIRAERGKKVPTQPFGSNNPLNLVLACKACNARKKHNFLSREQLASILERRFTAEPKDAAEEDSSLQGES